MLKERRFVDGMNFAIKPSERPDRGWVFFAFFDRDYFVRSGWVNLNNSTMRRFGHDGHGWSKNPTSYSSPTSANTYNLAFTASGVNPSANYSRWYGLPVRCLVY